MDNIGSGFIVFAAIFLFVLAVLWFILPFAIFGIKNRLDDLIRETKQTNALLNNLGRKQDIQIITSKAPPPARTRANA